MISAGFGLIFWSEVPSLYTVAGGSLIVSVEACTSGWWPVARGPEATAADPNLG
jgi:hypothetical protein